MSITTHHGDIENEFQRKKTELESKIRIELELRQKQDSLLFLASVNSEFREVLNLFSKEEWFILQYEKLSEIGLRLFEAEETQDIVKRTEMAIHIQMEIEGLRAFISEMSRIPLLSSKEIIKNRF
jgi:5'-deoxynucleotidase YfbR-like HD superfamily hydrolase